MDAASTVPLITEHGQCFGYAADTSRHGCEKYDTRFYLQRRAFSTIGSPVNDGSELGMAARRVPKISRRIVVADHNVLQILFRSISRKETRINLAVIVGGKCEDIEEIRRAPVEYL